MRIYIPVTVSDLEADGIAARLAFAVTAEVRAMAPGEDEEGWEYLAFRAAADASIDDGEVSRIVVAADAEVASTQATGVVEAPDVPWSKVVSIHIDDLSDGELLADLSAAQLGEEAARERVNAADLLWYDASERAEVVRLLAAV